MNKIGKYTVDARIGMGGMGTIYKAFDPYFERVVAIKVMSPQLAADEEFRARFFREARSTARLSHPNIITVYDLGEENGIPYLVMEYLEGKDLKSMILARSSSSLEEQVRIMSEACRGLAHAHTNGIIHRDVKPGNIFVTDARQVKLLDFGLARGISSATLTTQGSILGTPSYMSPEQWAKSKVDLRVDIFAVGAVFYELLTRRKAFAGETYEQIFYSIFHSDPEPLQSVNPALPADLCRVVHRAMAKDAAARYQTMPELLDELAAVAERLECARSELSAELSTIECNTGRLVEENKQFLEGTLLPPVAADSRPIDYLQLVDLIQQARKEWERFASLVAKRRQAAPFLHEAARLEREGNLEQALHIIAGVLEEDPDHLGALAMRQRLDSELERVRAEEARAGQVRLLTERAAGLLSADAPDACLASIVEALSLDPGNEEALRLKIAATTRLQELRQEKAARQRSLGLSLLQQGDFRASLAALQLARELSGDHPELDAALENAEARVREDDQRLWAEGRLEEARELKTRGELATAQTITASVVEAAPENAQARALLAEISRGLEEQRRLEKVAILLTQSRQALARRDFETAGIRVDEALQVEPESSDARNLLGEIEEARHSHLRMRIVRRRAASIFAVALVISILGIFFYLGPITRQRETSGKSRTDTSPSPTDVPTAAKPALVDEINKTEPAKTTGQPVTREPPAAVPATPAEATADLFLSTSPAVSGALVKINDVDAGSTDSAGTLEIRVKAGTPQILEVEKEGHQRFVKSLAALKSGERRPLAVELRPVTPLRSSASLRITSDPPDAVVYVDGVTQGMTPLQTTVQPGRHKIEVIKPGYRPRQRSSEWSAEEYNIEFSLEQESGTLQFSVEPAGTIATINGQQYDTGTQKRVALAPGTYTVLLSKTGYIPRELKAVVFDGQTGPVMARLDKALPPPAEFGESFLNLVNWSAPANWHADRQALLARGAGICWLKDRTFADFILKFSLRLTNGIAASWILRARDPDNYYRVEIRGDAYPDPRLRNTTALYLCADGKETEVQSLPIPIESRKLREWFQAINDVRENRFRIDVSGKLLSGTMKETWTVADFRDPGGRYSAGSIGFRVSGSELFEVNGLLVVPAR
jgi:hypothetical protein